MSVLRVWTEVWGRVSNTAVPSASNYEQSSFHVFHSPWLPWPSAFLPSPGLEEFLSSAGGRASPGGGQEAVSLRHRLWGPWNTKASSRTPGSQRKPYRGLALGANPTFSLGPRCGAGWGGGGSATSDITLYMPRTAPGACSVLTPLFSPRPCWWHRSGARAWVGERGFLEGEAGEQAPLPGLLSALFLLLEAPVASGQWPGPQKAGLHRMTHLQVR